MSIVYISFGYGFQIRWINIDKIVVFLVVYHISKFLLIKKMTFYGPNSKFASKIFI